MFKVLCLFNKKTDPSADVPGLNRAIADDQENLLDRSKFTLVVVNKRGHKYRQPYDLKLSIMRKTA